MFRLSSRTWNTYRKEYFGTKDQKDSLEKKADGPRNNPPEFILIVLIKIVNCKNCINVYLKECENFEPENA